MRFLERRDENFHYWEVPLLDTHHFGVDRPEFWWTNPKMMRFNLLLKFHVLELDVGIPPDDFCALPFDCSELRHLYPTPPQKVREFMKDCSGLFDDMQPFIACYYFLQLSRTLGLDLACWRRRFLERLYYLEYLILVVACFARNWLFGYRGFKLSAKHIDALEAEGFSDDTRFTFSRTYSYAAISRMMRMVHEPESVVDNLAADIICPT